MPFEIPTLKALAERTAGAFRTNLKGSDARLWPNNVAVSAKVIAGAVWESFSFLEYISRQINKSTAEGVWLERHAYDYGLARLAPTPAEGTAIVRGDIGVALPAGLTLARADGVAYESLTGGVMTAAAAPPPGAPAGEVRIAVRASAPGRAGNAFPGVVLTLADPPARVAAEAEVAETGIGGGADAESDESLRARLLFRLRNPPHGGAAHDYVIWAREVAGVTRVFVDPVTALNGRSSVGVYVLMDETYPDGIPQPADIARVQAHIEPLRPAGALVDIRAPVALAVDITIANLAPDTVAVRDAVRAELHDLFHYDVPVSTLTHPYTLRVSKLWEAISAASGEDSHTLTAPAADVVVPAGRIATLGMVTFVSGA